MSTSFDTTERFFRPADVGRVRRNQRRVQVQRVLKIGFNVIVVAAIALSLLWVYQRTQSDTRFAVRTIEVAGAVHTPRAALDSVTRQYVGLNLFKIDIGRVQHDLGGLSWVSRIAIEKKLPDTLRINVVERKPAALLQDRGALRYVDEDGVPFADLSPSVGDADLPIIREAAGAELVRTVALLRDLRVRDPQLFARVSEIKPVAPRGFAIYDRDLGAIVYANGEDLAPKWRALYSIVAAEQFGRASIDYADLRFADRIVVKPVHAKAIAPPAPLPQPSTQITN